VTQPELPSAAMPIPCLMGRCLLVAIIDGTQRYWQRYILKIIKEV